MDPDLNIETLLMHYAEKRKDYHGAVVPPIFQNSLFTFEDWDAIDSAFDDRTGTPIYSRGVNPTVSLVEEKIAKIAGGERARLFGSGMAAISAAVLHYLHPGDHVITVKNIYGPAGNLLNVYLRRKMNIETTFVSGQDLDEIKTALTDKTRLIYLESPSTAIFSLQDIEGVAVLANDNGINTILDNTWATPIFQKPLAMGIDMEVHSCSKYIGGHSDLVAGVVIGKRQDIEEISVQEFEILGGIPSPLNAWLIIRSLRTLPIRMRKHQETAFRVAQFLEQHPGVKKVRYPGLESFPQYELGKKQMSGYSGLMGFELNTKDIERIKRFFNSLKVFQIGVSWGGHESLIYAPAISYLKELRADRFEALGISAGDMRISIGLEDGEDLITDLDQALRNIE